jgi:hypothetical protein
LVICVSLSGRSFNKFEERSEALELEGFLKPDMGSLTLSSLNFNQIASINSPEMILNLANKMKNLGIVPELEAFDAGMINYAKYLIKKGLLEPPYYFNLIRKYSLRPGRIITRRNYDSRFTGKLSLEPCRDRRLSIDDELSCNRNRRRSQSRTALIQISWKVVKKNF